MSATMREKLVQLRRRHPFQPFRVHLKNGEMYDVLDATEFGVGGNIVGISYTPFERPGPKLWRYRFY